MRGSLPPFRFDRLEEGRRARCTRRASTQRAAAEYLQAFSFLPDPELLFNVAQVYRLAGDEALAIASADTPVSELQLQFENLNARNGFYTVAPEEPVAR